MKRLSRWLVFVFAGLVLFPSAAKVEALLSIIDPSV
jgi:hypothetical protein